MSRILLIDDDAALRKTLSTSLRAAGFEVLTAHTGEVGLYVAKHEHPELAVVDLGLSRSDSSINGLQVISSIRRQMTIPILVLSARDQESVKVEALNNGADDYVTKPFGIDELIARLRAMLRRSVRPDGNTVIETASFTVDLESKRVHRDGVDIHLTATEWRLLAVLIGNEGRTVARDDLLARVWGTEFNAPPEYARVYIGALRKKLELTPSVPKHLLTETSVGYRFVR